MTRHLMNRRACVAAYLLAFVLVAAACGAAEELDEITEEREFVMIAGQLREGYESFPSESSAGYAHEGEEITAPGPTVRVGVGDRVTITFENEHYVDERAYPEPHNFVVVADKDDYFAEPLWESRTLAISPGESDSVTFTPDAPGTYYYICSLGNHRARGMWGQFIVEP
ncbi:MAG: plastocyanin/azurin family copper-binding protein [Acidimicrobiia bacterium]